MFEFTFSKEPFKLGEYDPKFGQRWWCSVNEQLQDVSFNLMSRDVVDLEDRISAEEKVEKRTKAGKDYTQLKKVKVHKAHERPASNNVADSPRVDNSQLDRIEKQLSLILEGINDLKGIDNGAEEY